MIIYWETLEHNASDTRTIPDYIYSQMPAWSPIPPSPYWENLNQKSGSVVKLSDYFSNPTKNEILINKTLIDFSNSIYGSSLYQQGIINGGFTVNQRIYVSNAALAAGAHGHDMWKAGSGGGDYTFTQLAQSTVITIKAAKTLIQIIEDKNVIGGTYTLSWKGTAQARYAVNSATPGGAYAASPIVITGQNACTTMSVEFNAGTLSEVVLNSGSVALPFIPKSYAQEFQDCLRYCYAPVVGGNAGDGAVISTVWVATANTTLNTFIQTKVPMRITPIVENAATLAYTNFEVTFGTGLLNLTAVNYTAYTPHNSPNGIYIEFTTSSACALGMSTYMRYSNNTSVPIILSSDL